MREIVVDTSVVAAWLLPDEKSTFANTTCEQVALGGALAPTLFWFEIRNIFITNERKGRLLPPQIVAAERLLASLPIRLVPPPMDDTQIFTLARKHRLTIYDAAYLALALDERAPLASLDKALIAAAKAEGVELVG